MLTVALDMEGTLLCTLRRDDDDAVQQRRVLGRPPQREFLMSPDYRNVEDLHCTHPLLDRLLLF